MDGWIKTYREIMEHPMWMNTVDFKIFSWILFKANTNDKITGLKIGKGVTSVSVKRGQMIFGRHKAEEELFIDGSTIYKSIQRLEKWECVKLDSNNQYTLISVCNYEYYQGNKGSMVTSKEQPSNNQVTSKEQPSNTPKEDLEYKESKEEKELSEMEKAFKRWSEYRTSIKKPIHEASMEAAKNKLIKLSGNNPILAKEIVEDSIANGYQGLFELKNSKNVTEEPVGKKLRTL